MYKLLTVMALAGLMVGVGAGCRSAKKIQKVMAIPSHKDTTVVKQDSAQPVRDLKADSLQLIHTTLDQLAHNRIDFTSFSAHTKVHYEGSDGKDYELNAYIRI